MTKQINICKAKYNNLQSKTVIYATVYKIYN